jgi:hypothetical protein
VASLAEAVAQVGDNTHLVDFGDMLFILHCVQRSSSSRTGTHGASRARRKILASSVWCRLPRWPPVARWPPGGDTVSQDVHRIRRKARLVLNYDSSSRPGRFKLKLNFGSQCSPFLRLARDVRMTSRGLPNWQRQSHC